MILRRMTNRARPGSPLEVVSGRLTKRRPRHPSRRAVSLLTLLVAILSSALAPRAVGATDIPIDAVGAIGGPQTSGSFVLDFTGGLSVQGQSTASTIDEIVGFWGWGGFAVSDAPLPIPNIRFETSLRGAWPNPFQAQTTIGFAIGGRTGDESPTRLEIFDVTGRSVVVLIDEPLSAGLYNATWTGRNRSGDQTPSGIYFARLRVGAKTQTLRIITAR